MFFPSKSCDRDAVPHPAMLFRLECNAVWLSLIIRLVFVFAWPIAMGHRWVGYNQRKISVSIFLFWWTSNTSIFGEIKRRKRDECDHGTNWWPLGVSESGHIAKITNDDGLDLVAVGQVRHSTSGHYLDLMFAGMTRNAGCIIRTGISLISHDFSTRVNIETAYSELIYLTNCWENQNLQYQVHTVSRLPQLNLGSTLWILRGMNVRMENLQMIQCCAWTVYYSLIILSTCFTW